MHKTDVETEQKVVTEEYHHQIHATVPNMALTPR